jgi:hypothetical protein
VAGRRKIRLKIRLSNLTEFEKEENFSPEEVYVTMKENGVTETTIEEDGESFNAKILEFGNVDEKFWEFVQYNVCEEDMLKHRSIFLIKK